jgi:hypothetical protein
MLVKDDKRFSVDELRDSSGNTFLLPLSKKDCKE